MIKHDETKFELEKHERIITVKDVPEQYHYKILFDGKEIDDVQAIVRINKEDLIREMKEGIGVQK